MNINPIAGIIEAVGKVADDLVTSDEERAKIALEERRIDAQLVQGQLEINKAEAQSASLFTSGWRPAIGWCGAVSMAYQFILYPFMVWGWTFMQSKNWIPSTLSAPPIIDTEALWVLLSGMLGIAGARTFEKVKGVAR